MPLRAIAYASEAILGLSIDHLDDLIRYAARFNLDMGITGVLLYDGSRFLQYIEGPPDAIGVAYGRILAARSHHEFVELGRGHVSRRVFPYWSMQMLPAEPLEIRRVAQGDWSWLSRAGGLRRLEEVVLPHVNR